jgi:polygalacturonase
MSTKRVSVKIYGAVGNGSTDDTESIQNALNSGTEEIIFPDGIYMVNALVSLRPKSNQKNGLFVV